jgi:hypothetical protein
VINQNMGQAILILPHEESDSDPIRKHQAGSDQRYHRDNHICLIKLFKPGSYLNQGYLFN